MARLDEYLEQKAKLDYWRTDGTHHGVKAYHRNEARLAVLRQELADQLNEVLTK